jgi:hypothetical protein
MATFSLATLRRGADLTPAVGVGRWHWPLAAAGALGLAGLDTDVRSLFADECARSGAPTAAAIPAQPAEHVTGVTAQWMVEDWPQEAVQAFA